MNLNCISCSTSLNENSIFCFNCGTRIKCPSCEALLIKDAKFCTNCGTDIKAIITNGSYEKNTVHYHKTQNEIICDVSLTNEVGKEGIKELIQGLTNNQPISSKQLNSGIDINTDKEEANNEGFEDADVIDEQEKNITENQTSKKNETFPHINDVEMKVNCTERNWILIYAFYESDFATKNFSKDGVYKKYIAKRKTLNRQKSFNKAWKSLFKHYISTVNETTFKFIDSEKLKILKQLILGNGKSTKAPSSSIKRKVSNSKESNIKDKKVTKSIKSNPLSYTLVTDLDLHPKGKTSLKDFLSTYKPKKGPETLLLVVHYLQKILSRTDIDVNAIYTCYRNIPLKVPNIRQALSNIHTRNGWINTSDYSDLKLTVGGENHIEFGIIKSNS